MLLSLFLSYKVLSCVPLKKIIIIITRFVVFCGESPKAKEYEHTHKER